jgi:hypothetical protein
MVLAALKSPLLFKKKSRRFQPDSLLLTLSINLNSATSCSTKKSISDSLNKEALDKVKEVEKVLLRTTKIPTQVLLFTKMLLEILSNFTWFHKKSLKALPPLPNSLFVSILPIWISSLSLNSPISNATITITGMELFVFLELLNTPRNLLLWLETISKDQFMTVSEWDNITFEELRNKNNKIYFSIIFSFDLRIIL